MDTRLFLSVDGGGSKTEALLADMHGRLLGCGLTGGSNALSVGKAQAVSAVTEAVAAALGATPWDRVALLQLLIPGFSQCMPLLPMEAELDSDSPSAYFGALGQPGGIALLAGTGSFAVSFDEAGHETTVGGWGSMLGDEGSGYDIGRRAVIQTLTDYDAGRALSVLGREVLNHYDAQDASRLVHMIYQGGCDRERMAALCPVVGRLARQGERDALRIMHDAAESLADLAETLQRRLKLRNAPTALLGGVSRLGDVLCQPLERALRRRGLTLRQPLYTPALGGVMYTYGKLTGRMPSPELASRYAQSYQNLCKGE